MFRTSKDGVEGKLGRTLRKGSRVIPWLVKHAADLIKRYVAQSDGKTAQQEWKGVSFKKVVPEFGERVEYLEAGTKGRSSRKYQGELVANKGVSRWKYGHYLGVVDETSELIIGTEQGVVSARDFAKTDAT